MAEPEVRDVLTPAFRARLLRRGAREIRQGWQYQQDVRAELEAAGLEVRPFAVDAAAFERHVREAGYRTMDYWRGGEDPWAREKYLEHFVSLELLGLAPSDVVVDVASCTSPFPTLVRWRYGCTVYRQDLSYPAGVEGDRIGGDAAAMPVPDGFADALTLHCSFEHFEGDRDSRFLHEAARVLRPGGRLCILPLYLSDEYAVQTDPKAWTGREPELDPDAVVCVSDGWGEVHGRLYDVPRFVERVVRHLGDLRLELFAVDNSRDLVADSYLRMAALFTKPGGPPPAARPAAPPADPRNPDPTGHLERVHDSHAATLRALRDERDAAHAATAAVRTTYEAEMERRAELEENWRDLLGKQLAVTRRASAEIRARYEAGNLALEAAHRADTERIEALSASIPPLRAEVEALRTEIAGLTAEVERHDAERRATLAELAAIHRSKTWRLWMRYLAVRRFLLRPFGRR